MSTFVINGAGYVYPDPGDRTAWGAGATNWAQAVSLHLLQKTGGSFTLSAEVDFGSSYGLKTLYYKSRAAIPAAAGQIRLGTTESVSWRNNANGADLALSTDASDNLTFNGAIIATSGAIGSANKVLTSNGTSPVWALIVNANIDAAAAIAYTKLALTGTIVNADINASAAIAYSKLNLATSIVNADISNSAAIIYSKLSLTGGILNADINAAAAIAFSKLATLTSGNILVGSAGNVATSVAVTGDISLSNAGVTAYSGTVPVNKGGTGQITANLGFNALSPQTTKGDIIGFSTVAARLAVGTNGQVLTADSTQATGIKWGSGITLTAPTVQKFTSGSGTYTTPANVLYVRVKAVGAGGGGGGSCSNAANAGAGGAGGNTTFGAALIVANGGTGGGAAGSGVSQAGTGGTASLGTAVGMAVTGGAGGGFSSPASGGADAGGIGGSSALGGAGYGGSANTNAGLAGATNSGSGGGGASTANTAGFSGAGGGSGGYVDAIITSPSATYAYAVGAAGSAGAAGTSGAAGGAGGSGLIVVEEYYQ